MFSSRLEWNTPSNAMARLLEEKRLSGEEILDLTESNPTHAGIEYPSDVIAGAFAHAHALRYDPDPLGLPMARSAVSGYYQHAGVTVDPSRVVLAASTSEAYAYLFKLLTDPGDEILVPRPSYPLFDYLARLESIRTISYPLFYDHGWHLDGAALRALITPRTRVIIAVHPNNPTGSFLKKHEFEQLSDFAAEHDLALISDEVFSDYALSLDANRMGVAAAQAGVLTFSLSGLSKIVGLPQMKLGWMLVGGPSPLVDGALKRLELISDTYLSVGTPVQLASPALLGMREGVQHQIRIRLQHNLDQLRQLIGTVPQLRCIQPEGGWYAILQMPRLCSEEEWSLALLRDHQVLVQPGYFYDFESEAFLVISLLTEPGTFREGTRRICSNELLRAS